jgi:hypothetical protein
MRNLIYWWLFFWLQVIGIGFAAYFGVFTTVLRVDVSYISLFIFIIFFFTTLWIGLMTTRRAFNSEYRVNTEIGWFISELCMMLGMIGTVVGFIYTLVMTIGNGNFTDITQLQSIVTDLAKGVGIAGWTTLFGLIAGASIKIQMHNLENIGER